MSIFKSAVRTITTVLMRVRQLSDMAVFLQVARQKFATKFSPPHTPISCCLLCITPKHTAIYTNYTATNIQIFSISHYSLPSLHHCHPQTYLHPDVLHNTSQITLYEPHQHVAICRMCTLLQISVMQFQYKTPEHTA